MESLTTKVDNWRGGINLQEEISSITVTVNTRVDAFLEQIKDNFVKLEDNINILLKKFTSVASLYSS